MGSDDSVVNAARVSFAKESDNYTKEQNDKLLVYLAKNKHYSPFNHVFLSFRIKAPIFVSRQLVKHKFLPWNEVSRRYVDSEPEFFIPEHFRAKAENVKQGSAEEFVKPRDLGNGLCWDAERVVTDNTELALETYQELLDEGVCPEMARMVLPANMMTEWIWSGSLGAFADMLKLRLDPHSQKESRDVANLIHEQMLPLFPVSLPALLENK